MQNSIKLCELGYSDEYRIPEQVQFCDRVKAKGEYEYRRQVIQVFVAIQKAT